MHTIVIVSFTPPLLLVCTACLLVMLTMVKNDICFGAREYVMKPVLHLCEGTIYVPCHVHLGDWGARLWQGTIVCCT